LRDLREDQDLSQKEIAEILNVAQTTYSDYELGKINIPIELLCRIADYFETSIDYLLERTDIREAYPKKKR
ncbi:MAG: helix-turn-helix transcriptional regulator, partial [Christensenellaceae bacterium]|nr:helix-turn-helix transcriptional regulator [Christensenellaceae bacterium]